MTAPTSSGIDQHPDLIALRARSERAAATTGAQMVEGLSLLTGLYLAASPWIVGFTDRPTLVVNNLILGLAFTFLATGLGNAAYERTHGMSWAAAGIGLWTIISPWAVAGDVSTTATIVSNVITGSIAFLLALMTAAMGARQRR